MRRKSRRLRCNGVMPGMALTAEEWDVAGRWRWAVLIQLAAMPAAGAQQPAASPDAPPTFIEPTDAAHRHCSGACLKSGALQWFCRPDQTCSLDCGTAPPKMHCHDPRR